MLAAFRQDQFGNEYWYLTSNGRDDPYAGLHKGRRERPECRIPCNRISLQRSLPASHVTLAFGPDMAIGPSGVYAIRAMQTLVRAGG